MPPVSVFVVLSLVLAILFVAFVFVSVRELLRNVRKLSAQVKMSTERLVPLTEELQSELAVTNVEVEALTKSLERVSKEQATRRRRAQRARSKRKR